MGHSSHLINLCKSEILRRYGTFLDLVSPPLTKNVTDPILFGPGFAVGLAGLPDVEYLRRVWSERSYQEMCSLDARSINPGCYRHGD